MLNYIDSYLAAVLIIMVVPYAIWRVLRTDNYIPLVIMQIIIGIIIGPSLLGGVFPVYYTQIFTKEVLLSLQGVAILWVLHFVWSTGLEIDFSALKKNKVDTLVTSFIAFIVPFIFGCILSYYLFRYNPTWKWGMVDTWQFVVAGWLTVSVTAIPILWLFLEKYNILNKELWQRILRYASLDDLYIWVILAIILLKVDILLMQLLFIVWFAICSILIRKLLAWFSATDRLFVAIIWLYGVSFFSEYCGVGYILGAFLAWVVLDKHLFVENQVEQIRKLSLLILMPIFFMLTGLKTTFAVGSYTLIFVAIGYTIIAIFGRIYGVYIASKILKWKTKDAYIIGTLLQTKGLIEVIFIPVLLHEGIISSDFFTAILFMAILSTCITQPMIWKRLHEFR
jgi:Kef-type K+ transport system membrane component KefB